MRQRFYLHMRNAEEDPIYWRIEMSGSLEEDPFEDAIDFLKSASRTLTQVQKNAE